MKKILVAIDGSTFAHDALEIAVTLAKATEAEIILIHVSSDNTPTKEQRQLIEVEYADKIMERVRWQKPPTASSADYARSVLDTHTDTTQAVNEILGWIIVSAAEKEVRQCGLNNVLSLSNDGQIADEILKAATDHKCDTIVMGTRGMSDFRGALVGSVSHKVAHEADCQVILVK